MWAGILIVGSLWWETRAGRDAWRQTRLDAGASVPVSVSIRYGRKSETRGNSFTMTFSPEDPPGKALLVPCRQSIDSVANLVADPARFRHSASVGAYLGLTPRCYASGEVDRMGHISRCGGPLVRAYPFEAANVMLSRAGKPNPLKSWGAKDGDLKARGRSAKYRIVAPELGPMGRSKNQAMKGCPVSLRPRPPVAVRA